MVGKPALLILSLLLSGAALAADPPTPQQQRICRGGERQLGSRTRTTRRCLTVAQWRREAEERSQVPVRLRVTEGQNDGRVVPRPQ